MRGRLRYLVPNLFTAASAALGLFSMGLAVEREFELAAWFILWCVLLDKADGTAARLLNASSRFGTEFDSMADLIAFGLAPAMLVYTAGVSAWGIELGSVEGFLLVASCALFSLLAAVRLAHFNVVEHPPGERTFRGMPTTFCGIIVPSCILVLHAHGFGAELARYFPALMLLLGLAMVSPLPVPKVVPRKNKAFNIFQLANAVAVYVFGVLMIFPEYYLALAGLWIGVGTTYELFRPADPGGAEARST
ncbi:MAG: CDP-alcohol phosphatidyltransferase family protein [Deltaproteobacteria bacterium]|nr:CDP-alcohol phosphatidyltransferase family protein [Deltaproteobacteria bacterium]